MKYLSNTVLIISAMIVLSCGKEIEVIQLPSLPGMGLSGLYAGEIGGTLHVAGGCNYPDKPVTEDGKKVFYSDIWKLSRGTWTLAGHLPEPCAYGAYISTDEGLLILGGANSEGSLDSSWLVTADGIIQSQPLPKPLEQAAYCNCGGIIYLAGGISNGVPSLEVFRYEDGAWSVTALLPRPIVQGIACANKGSLNVFGGFDPVAKEAVMGGYSISLASGCMKEIGAAVTFVGSVSLNGLACGGCDTEVFTNALNLPAEEVREYQLQPVEYYKFRGQMLKYTKSGWTTVVEHPSLARAGAALARYRGGIVSAGGEIKPGIRSREVWMLKFNR